MAETSGSLQAAVSRRVRDPNATAHAALNVRDLFTHAQRIINTHTEALLQATDVTLSSSNGLFYNFKDSAPLIDKLLTIRLNDVDLPSVPFVSLAHRDPCWAQARGTPQVWAPVSRTMFAIYPLPTQSLTVSLVGTKTTGSLSSSSTATELRDQYMPAMLNLVEQLLLMRQRLFTSAKITADRRPFISKGGVQ